MEYDIILATQSEIRRNLLKNTGIRFKAIKSDFDETQLQDTLNGKICSLIDAQDLAKKLSFEKARNISDKYSKDLIIGCDLGGAGKQLFVARHPQQSGPTAGTRIAATRTIGKYLNGLH